MIKINREILEQDKYKDWPLEEIIRDKYNMARKDYTLDDYKRISLEGIDINEDLDIREFDFIETRLINCKINWIYINSRNIHFDNVEIIKFVQIENGEYIKFSNKVKIRRMTMDACATVFTKQNEEDSVDIESIYATHCIFNFENKYDYTILNGVKISGINNSLYNSCPEEGSFIGYKSLSTEVGEKAICKLLITEDAKRSSSVTGKCRASKVKVLDIYDSLDKEIKYTEAYSYIFGMCSQCQYENGYDEDACKKCVFNENENVTNNFCYKVGETIEIDNFDNNRWNECAPGIHFFVSELEAINY